MNKKIDYGIGVILIAGVIFVLLGYFLVIETLIGANQWDYTLHEWNEIEARMGPVILATVHFWFYVFVTGIFISLAGNCIALVRIFLNRSMDKKIDYGIGALLITGVILIVLGYFLLINTLVANNQMDHIIAEWIEIEMSLNSSTLAMLHFWFYTFVTGIFLSMAGNCIALVRIFFQKNP